MDDRGEGGREREWGETAKSNKGGTKEWVNWDAEREGKEGKEEGRSMGN